MNANKNNTNIQDNLLFHISTCFKINNIILFENNNVAKYDYNTHCSYNNVMLGKVGNIYFPITNTYSFKNIDVLSLPKIRNNELKLMKV